MIIPPELIGQLVEVKFYDHVSGSDVMEVLNCRLWGKLVSITTQRIVIQQWESDGSLTENTDNVVLVHSTVFAVKPLVYK